MGGTRLKMGISERANYWPVIDVHRPPGPEGLVRLVEIYLRAHGPSRWGLSLPGSLKQDGSWSPYTKTPGWEGSFDNLSQVRQLFKDARLPEPSIILNDCTALALGMTEQGTVAQISTGIGARQVQDGAIIMDGDLPYLATIREQRFEGRSFLEWLGLREMQNWLDPQLQGLSWRELVGHPETPIKDIARAAKAWTDQLLRKSPGHLFLGGGGALALRPLLEQADVEAQFAPDAERPGLEGLAQQLRARK